MLKLKIVNRGLDFFQNQGGEKFLSGAY